MLPLYGAGRRLRLGSDTSIADPRITGCQTPFDRLYPHLSQVSIHLLVAVHLDGLIDIFTIHVDSLVTPGALLINCPSMTCLAIMIQLVDATIARNGPSRQTNTTKTMIMN